MKTVDDYLALPYHISLVLDENEDGEAGWVAEVEELPGCLSQGASPDEAVEASLDAMAAWISVALEDGRAIPQPRTDQDYSGRLLVRMPRGLHATLAREADQEEVSLNAFITGALAGAVGWRADNERVHGVGSAA